MNLKKSERRLILDKTGACT